MKLKKMGALLLALCMTFMVLPTTVLADVNNTSGPDAEKKVIENDLVVQLPLSADEMIGTPPSGWLAVTSEPTWEDSTILDFVKVDQKFYDSTGKEMTDDDRFQNNSQYMVRMIFQSFESYHGDYYYVLSGKNNVYVDVSGQRYPMNVTADTDVNGNPVISAAYSFSIGTPPEEPEVPGSAASDWSFSCEPVKLDGRYRENGFLWMSIQNTGGSQRDIKGMKLYVFDINDGNNDLSEGGWDISSCVGTEENGHTIAPGETCEWNWLFDDDTRSEPEGESIPYEVVIRDAEGNELFSQQVEMTYAPVDSTYECVVTKIGAYNAASLDSVDVVVGQTTDYMIRLIRTAPDGTTEYVNTKSMILDWNTVRDLSEYVDLDFKSYDDYYTLSITGKKKPAFSTNTGVEFYFCYPSYSISDIFYSDEGVKFNYIEPQEIEVNTVYTISDKKEQNLYYIYHPTYDPEGEMRCYTLWTDGGAAEATGNSIFVGKNCYNTYRRQGIDPVHFQIIPTTDNARFELVESKQVTKIEFLSVPDSIIQDIRENGDRADLNGIQFKVTYKDGSTRTYEYSGTRDGYSIVSHMDWTPDGNIYECSYDSERNAISLGGFREPDAFVNEYYKIPDESKISDESKVNITEGLSEVTGNLGNTEYNTVEKIKNKLTETIVSNEGYTADHTVLYDIELVTSEDGGQTWIPVTAENFPKEGIEVTLPYPKGTNGEEYDFIVAHMFDEDVNGHKAGEVETPEVTERENGISFRVMGTSPVMIGYKKAAVTHTRSTDPNTDKRSPKTGDSANIALWIVIMFASVTGLSCTYFVRRKTKSDH